MSFSMVQFASSHIIPSPVRCPSEGDKSNKKNRQMNENRPTPIPQYRTKPPSAPDYTTPDISSEARNVSVMLLSFLSISVINQHKTSPPQTSDLYKPPDFERSKKRFSVFRSFSETDKRPKPEPRFRAKQDFCD